MEKLFLRDFKEDDEDIFEEFIFEHIANDEYKLSFENSLITGKQYLNYKDYNSWYETHKLIEQGNYTEDNTQAFNYFLLKDLKGSKQAVAVIELRTSLSSKTSMYGNLTIDVRPIERENGYYKEALKISLELASSLNMDKVELKVLDTDKYLLDVIKKEYPNVLLVEKDNVFSITFILKEILNDNIEDCHNKEKIKKL